MNRTLLLVAAALVACGGPGTPDGGTGGGAGGGGGGTHQQPQIGDSCANSPSDVLWTSAKWRYVSVCQDTSWLLCQRGAVAAFTCSGALGCSVSSSGDAGQLFCDFSGAVNGEPCPDRSVGSAVCGADAGYALRCEDGGTFSEIRCPNTPCYVSGGSIFCN